MKTHYELRGSRPAGILLRTLAFLSDLSICAWISTFALRGVALRFRAEVAGLLGVHALTLAIDAGSISPAELVQRTKEALLDIEVELLDLTFVFSLASSIVIALIFFGYFSLLEARPFSGSFGKWAFGLCIVDEKYQTFGLIRSIYRQVAKLLSIFSFGLGFLLLPLSRNKQALHDYVAGTYVIRTSKGYASLYRTGKVLAFVLLSGFAGYAVYHRLLVVYRWYKVIEINLPPGFFSL